MSEMTPERAAAEACWEAEEAVRRAETARNAAQAAWRREVTLAVARRVRDACSDLVYRDLSSLIDEMDLAPFLEAAEALRKGNAELDLLTALEAVPREVEIRREMDRVAARREDPCGQGLFGIAVKTDPEALQWQALDAELEVLAKRRLAAIAKARSTGAEPETTQGNGDDHG